MLLMISVAVTVPASAVVVLTETPVAEFTLPDGTVLKNAFVWRRNSQGVMIIHDDGQFFLNYTTLPAEWQAAYMGDAAPVQETVVEKAPEAGQDTDRYKIGTLLKTLPGLAEETREKLLERDISTELDQGVLVIGLMQGMLEKDQEAASRCLLFLEEKGYDIKEVGRDKIFEPCTYCGGDHILTKTCRACDGTGVCPECKSKSTGLGSLDKEEKTSFSNASVCRACDGTGKCAACGGTGKIEIPCPRCRADGQAVATEYCEAVRDKWVRNLNALVLGKPPASVITSPSVDWRKLMERFPHLQPEALEYYFSSDYDGGMDEPIVLACLMYLISQESLPAAKRFNLIFEVEFPKSDAFELENYVRRCKTCDATGHITSKCTQCDGTGECKTCGGTGDKMGLNNWKVNCPDCGGTGECAACGGTGTIDTVCAACNGTGRIVEKQRCEIRCEVLVEEMNAYFKTVQAGPENSEAPAE
jgi:hypothetical protein